MSCHGPHRQINACEAVIRENLQDCCKELSEWWDTGLLSDGKLRQAAALLKDKGFTDPIRMAERHVEMLAVRSIAERGAP